MSKKRLIWSEVWMSAQLYNSELSQISLFLLVGLDNGEVELHDPKLLKEDKVSTSFQNYERVRTWLLEKGYELLDQREDIL